MRRARRITPKQSDRSNTFSVRDSGTVACVWQRLLIGLELVAVRVIVMMVLCDKLDVTGVI